MTKTVHSLSELAAALAVEYTGKSHLLLSKNSWTVGLVLGTYYIFNNGQLVDTATAKTVVSVIKKLLADTEKAKTCK